MLAHYSAALDEIHRLRQAAAIEATEAESLLAYASMPVGARRQVREQIARMRQAAVGKASDGYAGVADDFRRWAMVHVGGSETLTRSAWEARELSEPELRCAEVLRAGVAR